MSRMVLSLDRFELVLNLELSMTFKTIKTAIENHVATLTFNRPDAMNALNQQMMVEVRSVFVDWESNPDVRVIVLTGSEKAFAAGADITEMVDMQYLDAVQENFLDDWTCIANCRKPTIAAVAGYALGGGCELAMMCDMLLAADNAQFGQPEIRIGTMPGLGGTQRLTGLIGKAKSMDLCLTGRLMGVKEAERAGMVSRIVPTENLLEEAKSVAETIAAFPAPAVLLAKEAVDASLETNLTQGLQIERRSFHSLFGTEDQREGMAAFTEKRQARFTR